MIIQISHPEVSPMKIKITQVEAIKATRYHLDPDAVLHGAA